MTQNFIKAGALAIVLVGFGAAGQAYAFTPLPLDRAAPFAVPVVDEQQQVDEHLNADEMPTNPPPPAMAERRGEPGQPANGGGDVEIKELQNMFPSTPWPKEN